MTNTNSSVFEPNVVQVDFSPSGSPLQYTNPYASYDTSSGAPTAPDTSVANYAALTGMTINYIKTHPEKSGYNQYNTLATNDYNKALADYQQYLQSYEYARQNLESAGYNANYSDVKQTTSSASPATFQSVKTPMETALMNPNTYMDLAKTGIALATGAGEVKQIAAATAGILQDNLGKAIKNRVDAKWLDHKTQAQIDNVISNTAKNIATTYGYGHSEGDTFSFTDGSPLSYEMAGLDSPIAIAYEINAQKANLIKCQQQLSLISGATKTYTLQYILPEYLRKMKAGATKAETDAYLSHKYGKTQAVMDIVQSGIGSVTDVCDLVLSFKKLSTLTKYYESRLPQEQQVRDYSDIPLEVINWQDTM